MSSKTNNRNIARRHEWCTVSDVIHSQVRLKLRLTTGFSKMEAVSGPHKSIFGELNRNLHLRERTREIIQNNEYRKFCQDNS